MSHKKKIFLLLPIIFLDVAGVVLVVPVLTSLILQADSTLISPHTSPLLRDFLYGLSQAIFPLCMFFSTPVLGDLSDKFGRKKILLICTSGGVISYIIGGVGIIYNNLFVLLLSRAIGGLMAGTQSIATAAIIDNVHSPKAKTINITWIVFASSLGLVFGPAAGGFTASQNRAGWFGYATPFFFTASISLLSVLLIYFFLEESKSSNKKNAAHLGKGFFLFMAAFLNKEYRLVFFLYFFFTLAWGFYYQTINWILLEKYSYTVEHLGLFVSFVGIVFACASLITRFILQLFSNQINGFILYIFIMGIANIGAALVHNDTGQWMWAIFNTTSYVICLSVSISLFSNLTSHESQGWIMGVIGSISALTWAIAGLTVGPLGYSYIYLPLWIACILCLLSLLLAIKYQR